MGVSGGVPSIGKDEEGLVTTELLFSTENDSFIFFPGDGLFGERGHGVIALVALVFAASDLAAVVAVVVVVVVAISSLVVCFFHVFFGVPSTGKTMWNVVIGGGGGGCCACSCGGGSCCCCWVTHCSAMNNAEIKVDEMGMNVLD